MYKEMQDAMSLGKGTLKHQIEKDVFKMIKHIELTVDQNLRAIETINNAHELQLRSYEKKIEIWTDIQKSNTKGIVRIENRISQAK